MTGYRDGWRDKCAASLQATLVPTQKIEQFQGKGRLTGSLDQSLPGRFSLRRNGF
jgi:hypothetical protein